MINRKAEGRSLTIDGTFSLQVESSSSEANHQHEKIIKRFKATNSEAPLWPHTISHCMGEIPTDSRFSFREPFHSNLSMFQEKN